MPIGWTIDGANHNDGRMLEPTVDDIAATGLLVDIDTMHLDRGYDSGAVRERPATDPVHRPAVPRTVAARSQRISPRS